jgi:integrase
LPFISLAGARALVELYAEKGDWKFGRASPEATEPIGSHDLRPSFVSRLISLGLDVVEVSRQARDTPETILRVYAHAFGDAKRRMEIRSAIYEVTRISV